MTLASVLPWWRLDCRWQGEETDLLPGMLSPWWRLLLLSDGSLTRHLQFITGQEIHVQVIDMSPVGWMQDGAPVEVMQVAGPWVRRQVWLQTEAGERLVYATSWWPAAVVGHYLQNPDLPIWTSLRQLRLEMYRDIRRLYYGDSAPLAQAFASPGPFWGRHYLFWHQGQPLTLIYEVLSSRLQRYLGASSETEKFLEMGA
ncbi:MAG: chorismate lyase [Gloeomargarita sp. SKYG116]|nr:chorismate lyase [Gloeomargarita sp. SKYG116]MCS7225507.1 chorismate lyase [Gloeomargarita sp. SKYB31]MDW8402028.1 chorismate lyase [Gloeomargarita sp. SKYGB_i_bin116]